MLPLSTYVGIQTIYRLYTDYIQEYRLAIKNQTWPKRYSEYSGALNIYRFTELTTKAALLVYKNRALYCFFNPFIHFLGVRQLIKSDARIVGPLKDFPTRLLANNSPTLGLAQIDKIHALGDCFAQFCPPSKSIPIHKKAQ